MVISWAVTMICSTCSTIVLIIVNVSEPNKLWRIIYFNICTINFDVALEPSSPVLPSFPRVTPRAIDNTTAASKKIDRALTISFFFGSLSFDIECQL